jgi:hypothetical protein
MQAVNLANGVPQFERAEYPESGGILRYYKGFKFPEKGFAFPQAIYGCNFLKREMVMWLKFFSKHKLIALLAGRKRALNDLLKAYEDVSSIALQQYFYKDEYYSPMPRQVRAFVNGFLDSYGVSSDNIALILATFFDHDNAYRYWVQDLALETTQEALIADFPRELERLLAIFAARDSSGMVGQGQKLLSIVRLAKIGWYVPKFKRAIRAGLKAIEWQKFLPDEADRHHMMIRGDYNHFGISDSDRWAEWMKIYDNDPPKLIYQISK